MSTIVIWVSDIQRSVNFYSAIFEDSHPLVTESFASTSGFGNEVLIHLLPEEHRSQPTLGADNPIKPVFTIYSIDKARLAAGRTGGRFSSDIQEHEFQRYVDGNDPDGHVIQLRES